MQVQNRASSVLSNRSCNLFLDSLDNTWIGQGAKVTQLIAFSARDLAHDAAHDLTRSGLGEVWDDNGFLRSGKRPDDLPDLKGELFRQGTLIVGIVGEFAG